jgi:hypothetical protein
MLCSWFNIWHKLSKHEMPTTKELSVLSSYPNCFSQKHSIISAWWWFFSVQGSLTKSSPEIHYGKLFCIFPPSMGLAFILGYITTFLFHFCSPSYANECPFFPCLLRRLGIKSMNLAPNKKNTKTLST